jgi:hypothetical protein
MGLELEMPESGCWGLAGSFGFERGDKYRVSIVCGERALLPAARRADADTLIIADGFSCRTQIEQSTSRTVMHSAEVMQMALRRMHTLQPQRALVSVNWAPAESGAAPFIGHHSSYPAADRRKGKIALGLVTVAMLASAYLMSR